MKYIRKTRDGGYYLIKKIKGKGYNFGTYPSLEEAKKYRDYFESKGWENSLDERLEYSTSKHPNRYIRTRNGRYVIIKKINGNPIFFGTYFSLEKAQKVRNYFENNGWNINERLHYTDICYVSKSHGKYMIRKVINGKREYISQWNTLEDAKEEVELLKKSNWDLDTLCEGIDETVDGELKYLDGVKKLGSTFQTHPNGRNDAYLWNRSIKYDNKYYRL